MKNLKGTFTVIFFTLVCIVQAQNINSISEAIKNKLSVNEVSILGEKNVNTFFYMLLSDSLLRLSDVVLNDNYYYKKTSQYYKKRKYDFVLETWKITGCKETVISSVGKALGYSSYEKPPKIVLVRGNCILVMSTWGALYRGDLYLVRDFLIETYNFEEIKVSLRKSCTNEDFSL